MTPADVLRFLTHYKELEPLLTPEELEEVSRLLDGFPIPPMPLSRFIMEAWHVVEPHTPYQHNWHIDAIANHLEAATFQLIRNLIINIQPRHMKSLLVSVFWPTWVWTFMPHSQWLFISHRQSLSTRDNLKRRRIIESPWYQKHFGREFQLAHEQRQKSWFENDQRGHMIASGLAGSIGLGADYIIGDDVLSREHAFSSVQRERANKVWDETIATRGNNPNTVVRVIIAQRLHQRDIVGHLTELEAAGGDSYDKLIIPTYFEPDNIYPATSIGWRDPRTKPGQLLWPERYNNKWLSRLRVSLGAMGSAAQLQQRPAGEGGNIFNPKTWRFWRPKGSNLPAVSVRLPDGTTHLAITIDAPATWGPMIQSWDASFNDNASSAYVVGQVWSKVKANYYLLDQSRDRMTFPTTLTAIRDLTARYPLARRKLIEEKANGPAIIQTLRNEIPGIIPVNPRGSKESRAHSVSPFVEAGNVFLPHPAIAPWVFDLIDECANFPASMYNDQVDTLTQALLDFDAKKKGKPRGTLQQASTKGWGI